MEEIVDLSKLLQPYLGETKRIQHYKIQRLTAAGENYGSLMLLLELTITNGDRIEQLSAVVKQLPNNEYIKKIFYTNLTFPNEIGFYKIVFPTIKQFLKNNNIKEGMNFIAEYYGSRLNLHDNNEEIDQYAALILANLKISDYTTLPRTVGCCYHTTKLVLKALAEFHAFLLALKLKQPQVFDEKIKPYLLKFDLFDDEKNVNNHDADETKQKLCDIIGRIDGISQFKDRLKTVLFNTDYSVKNDNFATVIHNDLWTNNIMVKKLTGRPTDIKIVDYQICTYGSIAKDLIFYLFTSVENDICRKHLDEFIEYYHGNFINNLQKCNCNLDNYSYDKFLNEINIEAQKSQIHHILIMLTPIFEHKPNEIADIEKVEINTNNITEDYQEKLRLVIEEFAKRNWI